MAKVGDEATTPARRKRQTRARAPLIPPSPPPIPTKPETPEDEAQHRETMERLERLVKALRQRNLDRAVQLAIEAQAGRGPLVDHFAELGRRFGADIGKPSHPKLRVIDGGREA